MGRGHSRLPALVPWAGVRGQVGGGVAGEARGWGRCTLSQAVPGSTGSWSPSTASSGMSCWRGRYSTFASPRWKAKVGGIMQQMGGNIH